MSSIKEIGEVSERRGDLEIEWTINDIFSYTKKDQSYKSPPFSVSGSNFFLEIFPYGQTETNSVGCISLFLMREGNLPCRANVNYTFGVKKADGTVENFHSNVTWLFEKTNSGFGYFKCIERSELLRRKSELAPSDALTLTCSLRVNQSFDPIERLDALSENLKDLFLSERDCDVTLKVKNQAFPVHKSILTTRSPVFAAMLGADMKEKHTGIINIIDCDPEPFKDFLMYLYSGKLENPSVNAFELYKIADKYQVKDLKSTCVGFIMGNLSLENVCDAIRLAHDFAELTLAIKTQDFFNVNFSKILSTDEWESLMTQNNRAANRFLKKAASKMKLIE